ncbi:Rhomboid Domain-Containing Protein 2 [Manis pentadactyla]|nr:Rhomboid Domain-Containing Protein 2 [Manis pentadactyla]
MPPPQPPRWLPLPYCRRRHCLLLRPRRGASERKRRRGARRTPQLDPSLQLQASAPPLPSHPHSQSPHAAGPESRAHWPAAVAVREGALGISRSVCIPCGGFALEHMAPGKSRRTQKPRFPGALSE